MKIRNKLIGDSVDRWKKVHKDPRDISSKKIRTNSYYLVDRELIDEHTSTDCEIYLIPRYIDSFNSSLAGPSLGIT